MSPGTEFARDFCAGIGPLQLGVVLVFFIFTPFHLKMFLICTKYVYNLCSILPTFNCLSMEILILTLTYISMIVLISQGARNVGILLAAFCVMSAGAVLAGLSK